jgi:methyl-accepting chemotaxis protein
MKNYSIKAILYCLVSLMIIFMSIIGVLSINNLKTVNKGLETVYNDRVVPLRDLKTIVDMYAVNIVDTTHKVYHGNLTFNKAISNVEEANQTIHKYWNGYLGTVLVPEEESLVAKIEPELKRADESVAKLKSILVAKDKEQLLGYIKNELYQVIDPVSEHFAELIEVQLVVSKEVHDHGEEVYDSSRNILVILLVIGLLISIIVAFMIIKNITSALAVATDAAQKLAEGDLSIDIDDSGKNEISTLMKSFKNTVIRLQDVVSHAVNISETVTSSSQELSVSAEQLTQTAHSQAEKVTQVAAAVEQVSATVSEVAQSASKMDERSEETAQVTNEGNEVVAKSISEVEEIAGTVESSIELANSLDTNSARIEEVLKVITDISEQTNLLALNAAIEAARAGDAGRGFAVVADEVRKLAEKSAQATSEISEIITVIQNEVKNVVGAMGGISDKVSSGVELSEETGRSLERILESISGLKSDLTQVAAAIEEVSVTTDSVASDVNDISAASEESAAAASQVNSSSESLAEMAVKLQSEMSFFKLK